MDICLPGMASKVKRAATSATRSDPFEMTMNWINVQTSKGVSALSADGGGAGTVTAGRLQWGRRP
jgi:hypothetical protein